MAAKITNKDRELMELISKFNLLTVSQIAVLSQRSRQVIRRRIWFLANQEHISTRERFYGSRRGRPEDLIYLTKSGWTFLCENDHSGVEALPVNPKHNWHRNVQILFKRWGTLLRFSSAW
jgi:predicted ArsR family transcriptional regulator